MKPFWRKKQAVTPSSGSDDGAVAWQTDATAAIDQALAQAPVPAMLKGKIRKELEAAAESAARASGHSEVTAQDVMEGLLAKMPANVRSKVEEAVANKDPRALAKLQKKLRRGQK